MDEKSLDALGALSDIANIAGMSATVATLLFGFYTYRNNIINADSRRVRAILLEIERDSREYTSVISEMLYSPVSHEIAMLVCEDAIEKNDINLAKNILNSDNNRIKNKIIIGINKAGKYNLMKARLSELKSKPLLIQEDLCLTSKLLYETIGMMSTVIQMSISPALYDKMLSEENICQFLEKVKDVDDPKEFAEELAIYFDHGPTLFMKRTGERVIGSFFHIIEAITRVWVDCDDKTLHKQKKSQKNAITQLVQDEDPLAIITQSVNLLKDVIPRESHIEVSKSLARVGILLEAE
jgi:hypothetical protein